MKKTKFLWLHDLPPKCRDDDVRNVMERYGSVQKIRMFKDHERRNAVVAFSDVKSAAQAIHNGIKLNDKTLQVEYCDSFENVGIKFEKDRKVGSMDNERSSELSSRHFSPDRLVMDISSVGRHFLTNCRPLVHGTKVLKVNKESSLGGSVQMVQPTSNSAPGNATTAAASAHRTHPDAYRGLRLTKLPSPHRLTDAQLRQGLFTELRRCGRILSVMLPPVSSQGDAGRTAIVTFRRPEEAQCAYQAVRSGDKLLFSSSAISVELHPGFYTVSCAGDSDESVAGPKTVSTAAGVTLPTVTSSLGVCNSTVRTSRGHGGQVSCKVTTTSAALPQTTTSKYPTRTLYVGGLTAGPTGPVTSDQLITAFRKFGDIMDVQLLTGTNAALIQFTELRGPIRATNAHSRDPLRLGGRPLFLAYTSSPPTRYLWIAELPQSLSSLSDADLFQTMSELAPVQEIVLINRTESSPRGQSTTTTTTTMTANNSSSGDSFQSTSESPTNQQQQTSASSHYIAYVRLASAEQAARLLTALRSRRHSEEDQQKQSTGNNLTSASPPRRPFAIDFASPRQTSLVASLQTSAAKTPTGPNRIRVISTASLVVSVGSKRPLGSTRTLSRSLGSTETSTGTIVTTASSIASRSTATVRGSRPRPLINSKTTASLPTTSTSTGSITASENPSIAATKHRSKRKGQLLLGSLPTSRPAPSTPTTAKKRASLNGPTALAQAQAAAVGGTGHHRTRVNRDTSIGSNLSCSSDTSLSSSSSVSSSSTSSSTSSTCSSTSGSSSSVSSASSSQFHSSNLSTSRSSLKEISAAADKIKSIIDNNSEQQQPSVYGLKFHSAHSKQAQVKAKSAGVHTSRSQNHKASVDSHCSWSSSQNHLAGQPLQVVTTSNSCNNNISNPGSSVVLSPTRSSVCSSGGLSSPGGSLSTAVTELSAGPSRTPNGTENTTVASSLGSVGAAAADNNNNNNNSLRSTTHLPVPETSFSSGMVTSSVGNSSSAVSPGHRSSTRTDPAGAATIHHRRRRSFSSTSSNCSRNSGSPLNSTSSSALHLSTVNYYNTQTDHRHQQSAMSVSRQPVSAAWTTGHHHWVDAVHLFSSSSGTAKPIQSDKKCFASKPSPVSPSRTPTTCSSSGSHTTTNPLTFSFKLVNTGLQSATNPSSPSFSLAADPLPGARSRHRKASPVATGSATPASSLSGSSQPRHTSTTGHRGTTSLPVVNTTPDESCCSPQYSSRHSDWHSTDSPVYESMYDKIKRRTNKEAEERRQRQQESISARDKKRRKRQYKAIEHTKFVSTKSPLPSACSTYTSPGYFGSEISEKTVGSSSSSHVSKSKGQQTKLHSLVDNQDLSGRKRRERNDSDTRRADRNHKSDRLSQKMARKSKHLRRSVRTLSSSSISTTSVSLSDDNESNSSPGTLTRLSLGIGFPVSATYHECVRIGKHSRDERQFNWSSHSKTDGSLRHRSSSPDSTRTNKSKESLSRTNTSSRKSTSNALCKLSGSSTPVGTSLAGDDRDWLFNSTAATHSRTPETNNTPSSLAVKRKLSTDDYHLAVTTGNAESTPSYHWKRQAIKKEDKSSDGLHRVKREPPSALKRAYGDCVDRPRQCHLNDRKRQRLLRRSKVCERRQLREKEEDTRDQPLPSKSKTCRYRSSNKKQYLSDDVLTLESEVGGMNFSNTVSQFPGLDDQHITSKAAFRHCGGHSSTHYDGQSMSCCTDDYSVMDTCSPSPTHLYISSLSNLQKHKSRFSSFHRSSDAEVKANKMVFNVFDSSQFSPKSTPSTEPMEQCDLIERNFGNDLSDDYDWQSSVGSTPPHTASMDASANVECFLPLPEKSESITSAAQKTPVVVGLLDQMPSVSSHKLPLSCPLEIDQSTPSGIKTDPTSSECSFKQICSPETIVVPTSFHCLIASKAGSQTSVSATILSPIKSSLLSPAVPEPLLSTKSCLPQEVVTLSAGVTPSPTVPKAIVECVTTTSGGGISLCISERSLSRTMSVDKEPVTITAVSDDESKACSSAVSRPVSTSPSDSVCLILPTVYSQTATDTTTVSVNDNTLSTIPSPTSSSLPSTSAATTVSKAMPSTKVTTEVRRQKPSNSPNATTGTPSAYASQIRCTLSTDCKTSSSSTLASTSAPSVHVPIAPASYGISSTAALGSTGTQTEVRDDIHRYVQSVIERVKAERVEESQQAAAAAAAAHYQSTTVVPALVATSSAPVNASSGGQNSTSAIGRLPSDEAVALPKVVTSSTAGLLLPSSTSCGKRSTAVSLAGVSQPRRPLLVTTNMCASASIPTRISPGSSDSVLVGSGGKFPATTANTTTGTISTSTMPLSSPKFTASLATTVSVVSSGVSDIRLPSIPGVNACAPLAVPPTPAIPSSLLQSTMNRVTRQQAMATIATTAYGGAMSASPTQQSTPSTDWHAPPKLANLVTTVTTTPRRRRSGNKTTAVVNSSSSAAATTEVNVLEAVAKLHGSEAPPQLSTASPGTGRQQQTTITPSPDDGGAILRQSIATRNTIGSANPRSIVVDPYEPNFDDDTPVLNFDPVQLHHHPHHHHHASLGPTSPPPPVTMTSSQIVVSPSLVCGPVKKSSLAPIGPVGGCCASPVSSISCRSPDSCSGSICVTTTTVAAISSSDLTTATVGSSAVVASGSCAESPRFSSASEPLVTSGGHQQQQVEAAPVPVMSALIPSAKSVDTVDEVIRDVCAGQFDVQSYLNSLRSDAFAVPRGGSRPETSVSTATPTSGIFALTTTTTISTSSAPTSLQISTAISSLKVGQPTGSTTQTTTAAGVPVVTANTLAGKPFPLSLSSESVVAAVTIPVNQMTSLLPGYQLGEKAGLANTTIRQAMPAPPLHMSSSSQLTPTSTGTPTTATPSPGVTAMNIGTGNALLNTLLAALQRIPGSQVTVTGPTAAAAGVLRGVVGQGTISAATITLPVCATPQVAANLKAALLSPSNTSVSSATVSESKPSISTVTSSKPTPISSSDSALVTSTAAASILSGPECSSSNSNRDDLTNAQVVASSLSQRQHSQVSAGCLGSLPVKRMIESTAYTTPCQVSLPKTEVTNTSNSNSMPPHKPPTIDHPAIMSALKMSTAPGSSAQAFSCDMASLYHHSMKPVCSPQPMPFRQAGNILCECSTSNNTSSSPTNSSMINLGGLSQSVVASKPGQHLMSVGLHKQLGQSLAAAAAAPAHIHLGGLESSAIGAVGSHLPPSSLTQTASPRILCPRAAQMNRELLSSTSPSLLLGCTNPLSSAPPPVVATNSSNTLDSLLSRLSGVVQPAVLMAIAQAAVSVNGGPLLGAAAAGLANSAGGGENTKTTSFCDSETVNQTLANIQRVVQLMEAKQQQQHHPSSIKAMPCGPPPGQQMRQAALVSQVSSALSPDNIRRRGDSGGGGGGGGAVVMAGNETVATAVGQQALSSSVSPGVRQQPIVSLQQLSAANDSQPAWNNTLSVNYPLVWQGRLSLKNAEVRVDLHFIQGNAGLLNSCMTLLASGGGGYSQQSLVAAGGPLRIVQRMRLERTQLEGVQRKINQEGASCSCLALPAGNTPIERLQQTQLLNENFINYMQEKMAAGIINVGCPDYQQGLYVVHIFPPCEFSHAQLSQTVPDLHVRIVQTNQPHLLVVITTV